MKALSVGLPGRLKSSVTLYAPVHVDRKGFKGKGVDEGQSPQASAVEQGVGDSPSTTWLAASAAD